MGTMQDGKGSLTPLPADVDAIVKGVKSALTKDAVVPKNYTGKKPRKSKR